MKTILIVDDEVEILRSLARVFFDTDYKVITATSAEEGLKLLEDEEINLIISDVKMPIMDGYEFLSIVKEKYPHIIRTILSGYTEESKIFKAVLNSVAKVYFYKPWVNEELLNAVIQLFETEDLLTSKHLLEIINNIHDLPTIESRHKLILEMIENDQDIKAISEEIEKDLAISTTILHVANSAACGLRTGSVQQAAVYIGLQNVKSIIYATSIINGSTATNIEFRQIEILWDHALLTNKILMYIYEKFLHKKLPEIAFSAGLLHNVGVVIFLKYCMKEYLKCGLMAKQEGNDLLDIERQRFKVTHQEIGGYLIQWWGLPYPLVEVALFHHNPVDLNVLNKELVCCVYLAQKYAWNIMKKPSEEVFYPEVFEVIGIDPEQFEKMIYEENYF